MKTGIIITVAIILLGIGAVGFTLAGNMFDITSPEDDDQIHNETMKISETPFLTSTKTAAPATPTSIPTPKSTDSPTTVSTFTATATKTRTPTTTSVSGGGFDEFLSTVIGEAEVDAEIPVHLRGMTAVEGDVVIIAMNLTAGSEDDLRRGREVNTLITSGFAQAVYHHDNGRIGGNIPKKLRIAEVNNTRSPPKTLYVNTSLTRDYYLNKISAPKFTNTYWNTERNMTNEEEEFISGLDKSAENVTLYNESAK